MKHMKKLIVAAMAVVTAVALCVPALAFADTQDSGKGGNASITITLPTTETAPTGTTTYKIYKVFDATSDGTSDAISYKLVSGKSAAPAGFTVDTAGNVKYSGTSTTSDLTADDIAAIAAYVGNSDLVYTATVAKGETSVVVTGLEYGYYYISSSTGTVVTVDSTNPNATVNDKNVIPSVVKSAGTAYDEDSLKAIAAVGTDQPFTAVINKTHGATNLVFSDTMTNMTYNADVVVTVNGATVAPGANTFAVTGAKGDSSFSITFVNSYIDSLADNTKITLNYSGKVTSDALSANPATNKATLTSGDGNTYDSETVEVYNAKFTVVKLDGSEKPLKGAGFKLYKMDGQNKVYYKLENNVLSWVTDPAQATEVMANGGTDSNTAVFTGLGDGTYYLSESTTPAGYNTLADPAFTLTIAGNDYTTDNLEQEAQVVNQAGAELPSTGGIGTTIFYIVGAVLVIGAAVVLITKRRVRKEEEQM